MSLHPARQLIRGARRQGPFSQDQTWQHDTWYHPIMSADIERWDPPNDPTAFESLCLELWRDIWNDPNAQKNGRSGQPQAGVDVFGQHDGKWAGVQCKQKDGLLWSKVT